MVDAQTGLAGTSDLAIDDIQLNNGACPTGIEGIFLKQEEGLKKKFWRQTHFGFLDASNLIGKNS